MYVNTLIGLEENMPTYGIDGKRVNGHVTITTPGFIKCYVQNLSSKDNRSLVLYVFSSKDNKGVRLGNLMSPSQSKETRWQINENNVMNSGIKARDIDAAAVVKEGNSMRSTDTVLSGFARTKYLISAILEELLPDETEESMNQTAASKGLITPIQGLKGPTQGLVTGMQAPTTSAQGMMMGTQGPGSSMQGTGMMMGQGMTGTGTGMQGTGMTGLGTGTGSGMAVTGTSMQGVGMTGFGTGTGAGVTGTGTGMQSAGTTGLGTGAGAGMAGAGTSMQGVGMTGFGTGTSMQGVGMTGFGTGTGTGVTGTGIGMQGAGVTGPRPTAGMQGFGVTGPRPTAGVTGQGFPGSLQSSLRAIQELVAMMQGPTGVTQGGTASVQGSIMSPQVTGQTAEEAETDEMDEIEEMDEMEEDEAAGETEEMDKAEEMEDIQETEETTLCQIEKVLQEAYTKQKNAANGTMQSSNKKEEMQPESNMVQEETQEEMDYLEEIERKLRDIQARLKGSDNLEQNIRSLKNEAFTHRKAEPIQQTKNESNVPIEDIISKIVEFKNSVFAEGNSAQAGMDNDRLSRLYNRSKRVNPFEYEQDGIDWVRISIEDLSSIDALPHQWCTQPFVTFSYYKYNEIILGKERGLDKYYLGIPDIYHPERRNILESDTKIETFLCRSNVVPAIGEYGYWLISL